jgi:hypothetical protein
VLLNSWKEIAAHLKCGVRTAQRWQRELHMPVMRVRDSKRGAVIAESEALDEWMRRRSSLLTGEAAGRRASALTEQSKLMRSSSMWLELDTGRQFARLAKTSKVSSTVARRRQAARKAYDTLRHYLSQHAVLSKSELKDFHEGLREFRRELEQLGEVFDR